MAYNNYFPVNYPQYPQTYQQPQAPQNMQSGIIWVQGEAGAKSYIIPPNTTVQLWDSESQKIYLKSADASGMPSIRTLEYTICDGQPAKPMDTGYATTQDLKAVTDRIDELKAELDSLRAGRHARKESDVNE